MNGAVVSVVIPTKNDAEGLAKCIDGILSQTIPVHEILVIDSGSTDGTTNIARQRRKTRLLEIPASSFNHGETRNIGIDNTTGDFILFTVQDAMPVDRYWLESLLCGFCRTDIAAVWGAQIVPDCYETNPIQWFRPVSEPRLQIFSFESPEAFRDSPSALKSNACSLDNVTALYRRSALEGIRFQPTNYGEDMLFAVDALNRGWKLARNPAARVYHFHLMDYETTLKRTIISGIMRWNLFGVMPERPTFRPLATAWHLVKRLGPKPLSVLHWWHYNRVQARAINDALDELNAARIQGGDAMTTLHARFASSPPVPLKSRRAAAP